MVAVEVVSLLAAFSVLLALKIKAGLQLKHTYLATVLAPPRSAKSGKGMGGTEDGAGGVGHGVLLLGMGLSKNVFQITLLYFTGSIGV